MPNGHFIEPAFYLAPAGLLGAPPPVSPEPAMLIFGAGEYQASNVYLSIIPSTEFASGVDPNGNSATRYFSGMSNGQPTWSSSESSATPIVTDVDPANPTIVNVSVFYSQPLGLWLMVYDGGRGSHSTEGLYFTYAPQPWGRWSTPQLVFNACRDKGYGNFIFYYYPTAALNNCPSAMPAGVTSAPNSAGPAGPTIGAVNDPNTTRGATYAPTFIERFTIISASTLKLFYMFSTWNPYAVVMMESDFNITQINSGGIVNNASYDLASSAIAPGAIAAIFGTNLTDGTSCLPSACNPSFGSNAKLNTTMAGAQVTINGIPVPIFYAAPTQLGVQIPFEVTGTSATAVISVGGQASTPATVNLASISPGIFTFAADGKGPGAITHVNGSPVTVQSPAQRGELVILYATGLGQVAPSVPTGALPTGASSTVTPVTLTVGGINVIPDFAGLAGCCVGLNQVNFRVPASISPGSAVPVVLSIGGQTSNTATLAVQ